MFFDGSEKGGSSCNLNTTLNIDYYLHDKGDICSCLRTQADLKKTYNSLNL